MTTDLQQALVIRYPSKLSDSEGVFVCMVTLSYQDSEGKMRHGREQWRTNKVSLPFSLLPLSQNFKMLLLPYLGKAREMRIPRRAWCTGDMHQETCITQALPHRPMSPRCLSNTGIDMERFPDQDIDIQSRLGDILQTPRLPLELGDGVNLKSWEHSFNYILFYSSPQPRYVPFPSQV